jgi:lipid-binding SYLF domain-containing protein
MKRVSALLMIALICGTTAFAANDEREAARVKESGQVLKEILNIPDDIPQDLLDKAECIVILPSVKKELSALVAAMGAAS